MCYTVVKPDYCPAIIENALGNGETEQVTPSQRTLGTRVTLNCASTHRPDPPPLREAVCTASTEEVGVWQISGSCVLSMHSNDYFAFNKLGEKEVCIAICYTTYQRGTNIAGIFSN